MLQVKDEILEGEPRYKIRNKEGSLLYDDVTIEQSTPVIQEGTPVNKALFDSIQADFDSTYRNIPKGLICMWSGSDVPIGWYLCNGENGTPDLRNRFIVGAGDEYAIGNTGGSNTVTLTVNQIPSHRHDIYTTHANGSNVEKDVIDAWVYPEADSSSSKGSWRSDPAGGGQSHENRPPYYALAYIMKG